MLNLGHTFGHALEAMAGYDNQRIVHGEGVSIGMVLAHQFSNRLNHCSIEDAERVETHLKSAGSANPYQPDIPASFPPPMNCWNL